VIDATSGSDTIFAGSGNDLITGGAGITTIVAGTGASTFVFNSGFGLYDITENVHGTNSGNDTLRFGSGLLASSISLAATPTDLTINFSGTNDRIILRGELASGLGKNVGELVFSDDSTIDISDLLQQNLAINDVIANDVIDLRGTSASRTVNASGNNQT